MYESERLGLESWQTTSITWRPSTPNDLAMLPISLANEILVACQTLHEYLTISATSIDLRITGAGRRSEEQTSELQSLMRISYAVFCLKKQTKNKVQLSLRIHSSK